MSSLEFGWTWHLLTAERESHSSARFASSKLPHGVSSASASGDWRAGPKCRKKVTANQVTLWPQWAGLVCWLVVTKCSLRGCSFEWLSVLMLQSNWMRVEMWSFLCCCPNPTERVELWCSPRWCSFPTKWLFFFVSFLFSTYDLLGL